MREYILRRMLLVVPIMLGVAALTFFSFQLIAGDVVDLKCGITCPEDVRQALREDLGLARPLYEQFGDWLWGVMRGDLGKSLATGVPVTTELGRRLPITAELLVLTMGLSLLFGIPAGVISAVRPGSIIDSVVRVVNVLWLSVPSFYLAILVILFGFVWFGWSPPQFGAEGHVSFFDNPWVNLQQFLIPAVVLALGSAAIIMRLVRSSMLEVLRQDYIRTAWSKGLRERAVVTRHAIKNASIPVVTILGLEAGGLLGGAVIIESIFALNGVGKYLLESVLLRDIFVVQSVVLFFAATYVVINLAVDVSYAWLDPRIRYS
ncbi:MAG: ABC transporter permease [Chloroflexi bacterium]|nr:ABC transporter permease [Chloroflexota bacterium]